MTALKTTLRNYTKWLSLLALILCVCAELPEYCGDGSYDFNNQFCFNNKAYDKCGGGEYNPETYFCVTDTLYELCGGKKYDPVKQKCENGEAVQIDTTKVITTFTVFYYGNGQNSGTVPEDPNSPYDSNSVVTVLDEGTLLRNGHNFSGWNMEANDTAMVRIGAGERFNINTNTKLHAVWIDTSVTTYKVTVGKGTGGGDYEAGKTVTITAEVAPTGYQFENWTTQSGVIFEDKDNVKTTFTMPSRDVAVTANWTAVIYPITYNLDNDVNNESNPSSYTVESSEITLNTPTRTGYTFEGWYESENYSGSPVTTITAGSTGNKTYWAKWTIITYEITFNPNGGSVTPTSKTAEHGQTLQELELPTPTRTGFNFDGWYSAATGGTEYENNYIIKGDITLYAYWEWTKNSNMLTDSKDGKKYKTVVMPDGKNWMSENLNFETGSGSYCYNDSTEYCDIYGRLYTWSAAMAIDETYNTTLWNGSDENHQGACPAGWHLPSNAEWSSLIVAVGGVYSHNGTTGYYWNYAGTKLKSQTGWNDYNGASGNGTDDHGFSALPGGGRYLDDNFYNVGNYGHWWSATEDGADDAWYRYVYNSSMIESSTGKGHGHSVRCVEN